MSALDPHLRSQVQSELLELHRKIETTFIMVTHDQDEAMLMGTRLGVMKDGELIQNGTPREVYSRPKNKFVAEFLWGANILSATRQGDRLMTTLGPLKTEDHVAWQEGHLAIRPELIVLEDQAARPKDNRVRAKVIQAVYRGPSVELLLDPGPVKVVTSPRFNFNLGDTVSLFIPPADLVALESQAV
jgi:ABC-type Fe3+/spermidine/putrescine transport system ATPase subunit